MPFIASNLVLMQTGKGRNWWSYFTTDAAATVDTTGYFDAAAGQMNVGDLIHRVTLSGAAVSTTGWHVVLSNDAGVVDVSDTTALSVTDTD
jgi:hypothetical protein